MSTTIIDVVELILVDFSDLDVKKVDYGYDVVDRERANRDFAAAFMRTLALLFLDMIKTLDQPLFMEEVFGIRVDEDLMFRELDEAWVIYLSVLLFSFLFLPHFLHLKGQLKRKKSLYLFYCFVNL